MPLLFVVDIFIAISVCLYLAGRWNLFTERLTAFLVAATLGICLSTTVVYLTSIYVPLSSLMHSLPFILALGALVWAEKKRPALNVWYTLPLDKGARLVFFTAVLLFCSLSPKFFYFSEGAYWSAFPNAFGDVPWHVGNITSFAEGQSFPPENPIFAGHRLVYPFLPSVLSAWMVQYGFTITQSITLVSLFLIPTLLTLFYLWVRGLTSRTAAIFATMISLFYGVAITIPDFFSDLFGASNPFLFLLNLKKDYTITHPHGDTIHFLNPLLTSYFPQRNFTFGIPLAFSILILIQESKRVGKWAFIVAAIAAGLLPWFHTHTVLALIPAILLLLAFDRRKEWLWFFGVLAVLAIPTLSFYATAGSMRSHFAWFPGWMRKENNFVLYWVLNWGLLIPTLTLAVGFRPPKPTLIFAGAGAIVFATANLFRFAVWEWDNYRLLLFSLYFFLPLICWFITLPFTRGMKWGWKVASVCWLLLHTFTGIVDIWKYALPNVAPVALFDAETVRMADKIATSTPPKAVILGNATHLSPIFLAGRYAYLGYPGHVWSHGWDHREREAAMKEYLEGVTEKLAELTPDYILISPPERALRLKSRPQWVLKDYTTHYALYQNTK